MNIKHAASIKKIFILALFAFVNCYALFAVDTDAINTISNNTADTSTILLLSPPPFTTSQTVPSQSETTDVSNPPVIAVSARSAEVSVLTEAKTIKPQEAPLQSVKEPLIVSVKEPVNLQLTNNEKENVNLRIISGKNDLTVSKKYQFLNVNAEEIADIVKSTLSQNGNYSIIKDENSIIVTDLTEKIDSIFKILESIDKKNITGKDGLINYFHYFKNIPCAEAISIIRQRLSSKGNVASINDLNILMISDFPSKIDEIKEMIVKLEAANQDGSDGLTNYFYKFKNISSTDALPFIRARLSSKGKITSDNNLNVVMISDYANKIDEIKSIIDNVDVLPEQVEISVSIMEIIYVDGKKVGVDWNQLFDYGKNKTLSDDQNNQYSSSSNYVNNYWSETLSKNFNIGLNSYSNLSLSDFINLLVQNGSAKIQATPKISILNNQRANLSFTDKLYYANAGGSKYENSEDIGLTLTLTPQITNEGLIKLQVTTNYSSVESFTNLNRPVISTRNANTTVVLKDGATFFIGGLVSKKEVKTDKKTPGLGSIPVLGYLFKREINSVKDTEIVISLTPKIIKK